MREKSIVLRGERERNSEKEINERDRNKDGGIANPLHGVRQRGSAPRCYSISIAIAE